MTIRRELAEGVLELRIDRPERENAMTAAMYAAMADAMDSAGDDAAVRVILITGNEQCFTAGNDIAEFFHQPPVMADDPVYRFLDVISQCRKPVIAAVCGVAVGIGTNLLLHCDVVYAGDNASFKLPFVPLGLVPGTASSLLLPPLAGRARASEKLLFGEAFGADEAMAMGLVSAVLPATGVLPHARQRARLLATLPQCSVQLTRDLLRSESACAIASRITLENRLMRERLQSDDARRAFAAFLEWGGAG